jgi:membrane associated rhomboid family serine protease
MLSTTTLFPSSPNGDGVDDVEPGDPRETAVSLQDMLRARLPRLIVTPAILAGIVAVFLAMAVTSGELGLSSRTLIHWGAQFGPAIAIGQWWRLLTAMWLHANPLHLALNALFLWRFGSYVERLLGHVVFLIVYLLAGVMASVVSLQFQASNGLSVGASGALFGLVGVLLMVAMTSRGSSVLGDMLAELRPNLISVVGINLMLGFMVQGIDNAAHLGGIGAGLFLGWLVGRHSRDAIPSPRVTVIPIVLTAILATAATVAVGQRDDVRTELAVVATQIDDAEAAFHEARRQIEAGRRTPAEVAADVERTVFPFIRDAQARAAKLTPAAPAAAPRRDTAPPDVRTQLTVEQAWQLCLAEYDYAWQLRVTGLRGGDAARILEGDQRAKTAVYILSRTLARR